MKPGAEASPFWDREWNVVYKLFDVRNNGALGKKIALRESEPGSFEIVPEDAVLQDTLQKLSVLNSAGALPTEIVGLSDDGHYLIAKQPLADQCPAGKFESDRDLALHNIHGVVFGFPGLRNSAAVIWELDQAWLLGDLHERNIMRDNKGCPTIIDALVGLLSTAVIEAFVPLAQAIEDAQCLRRGEAPPVRKRFDDVNDDDL